MPTTKVDDLFKDVKTLSSSELNLFLIKMASLVVPVKSAPLVSKVQEERTKNGRVCPLCGSKSVRRNGKDSTGKQRYQCLDCHKSFRDTTNSIISGSSLDETKLNKFFECMVSGKSVRETADICGINKNTAFAWRHKVLDALTVNMENDTLSGIVEADETFFRESYKGNHKNSKSFSMPRKAKHRGESATKRGLSTEQICVPCILDRNGMVLSKIACQGRLSEKALTNLYDNKIADDSILITDELNAYVKYAKQQNIELVQLKSAKRKGKKGSPVIVKGIYHIQNINSYHSGLKLFMTDFKGVSTKHLNNYLTWYKWLKMNNDSYGKKPKTMLKESISALNTTRVEDIPNRPAMPIV